MPSSTKPQFESRIKPPDSTDLMTPQELAACMIVLRWGNAALASELHWSEFSIRKTLAGRRPIETEIAKWLRLLAAAHIQNEAPSIVLTHGPKPSAAA